MASIESPLQKLRDGLVFAGSIGAFVVVIALLVQSCDADKFEVSERFFADLREGRIDAAYAQLSAARRAELSREAFAALVGEAPYARHSEAGFGSTKSWGPVGGLWHACAFGGLTVDGDDWYLEVHLTQSKDEGWRVDEWAAEPPRPLQSSLIESCRVLR
ncbi:MAG: hypothetical protein EP330_08835 [Deltaproteobacteria bacterium]|nr:MAG: hypothetical protein EP330_08835 [Deltaproteobacteria bacterium]